MKKAEQLQPNYAPVYAAALYPKLAKIFQKHGYALAVHGSLARDFDIIAVPWAETLSSPEEIIKEITDGFVIHQIGEPTIKRYGRVAYLISVGFGDCAIDLSFFPNTTTQSDNGLESHQDDQETSLLGSSVSLDVSPDFGKSQRL